VGLTRFRSFSKWFQRMVFKLVLVQAFPFFQAPKIRGRLWTGLFPFFLPFLRILGPFPWLNFILGSPF